MDQRDHKPCLGPAVVSAQSPRAFALTGAMVTVRSLRRNINPAHVHLTLMHPPSCVHKVMAPSGAAGGLLAGYRGCGVAACPPRNLLSP